MEKIDDNIVGNTVKVIGWIFLAAGLIAGLVLAVSETFLTAMLVWASAIVIGTLLLGVSEVIRLLQLLVDRENNPQGR